MGDKYLNVSYRCLPSLSGYRENQGGAGGAKSAAPSVTKSAAPSVAKSAGPQHGACKASRLMGWIKLLYLNFK